MPTIPDFTVSNTITVAIAIYKDNLRKFFKLSLIAHLWLMVPIYGWARYFAIAAWMSKLSLDRILDKQDDLEKQKYFTIRSLFLFFITALINVFIVLFTWFAIMVFFGFVVAILEEIPNTTTISNFFKTFEQQEGIATLITRWSFILLLFLISIFIHSTFFVSDLCLTTKSGNRSFGLISKSHAKTKRYRMKTFAIILTSFIISFTLSVAVYIFYACVSHLLIQLNFNNYRFFDYVIIATWLFTCFLAHAVALPFWQSLKATTFYQITGLERKYTLR